MNSPYYGMPSHGLRMDLSHAAQAGLSRQPGGGLDPYSRPNVYGFFEQLLRGVDSKGHPRERTTAPLNIPEVNVQAPQGNMAGLAGMAASLRQAPRQYPQMASQMSPRGLFDTLRQY